MSRKLLVCLVLLSAAMTTAFAQITITYNDIPGPGNTVTNHSVDNVAVNNSPSGPNHSWNVPNSSDQYGTSSENIVSPASTPYAASFPTATAAVTELGSNSYVYYRVASNGIFILGFASNDGGLELIIVYQPEALLAPLPLTYGASSWTTLGVGTMDMGGGISVTLVDSTLNSVDGWGTITTAYGTWNILRMAQHQFSRTTMTFPPPIPPQTQTTERWSYGYRAQGGFQGVNISNVVEGNDPNFTQGDVNVSEVSATSADQPRGPVADRFSIGQNYPNPFNPTTILPLELDHNAAVTLTIYDETGRTVSTQEMELPAGSYNLPIDGSNWATGAYFARVNAEGQSLSTKMMLVK